MELYEHNQAAYDAALPMLMQKGRAAVIHPTGTGKSFIGLKLAAEHPDREVRWLSPSEHIFSTQMENLRAKAGRGVPGNVRFMTYAKLALCADGEIAAMKPGFIVLDEFHRAGARQWGRGVERLLAAHPGAPVLGLSATGVRYLDGGRDMAGELFGGSVASSMSLGESIARGILRPPVYITSVYSCRRDMVRLRARAGRSPSPEIRENLERLRRALDMAEGLGAVFKKHMKGPNGKYIAFCSGVGHMRDMMARVPEWFAGADARVYSVHAGDPLARSEFAAFRKDSGDRLRLLFCIDMLNEGIHVEDVDGVLLFRPTVSPIVYKQQIGRALSAGSAREPVIFDIVNNFESLYSIDSVEEEMRLAAGRLRAEGLRVACDGFALIDEAKDCRRLFEELERSLMAPWDAMFGLAKSYYDEHGDLLVPRMYRAAGMSLGLWVETQRKARRRQIPASLTEERAARLDSIGMVWENPGELMWEARLAQARGHFEAHGHLKVGAGHETESGFRLGAWLSGLRKRGGDGIAEGRRRQLDEIGMVWDMNALRFEENFRMAEAHWKKHGHLDAGQADGRLSRWLCRMRHMRARGELDGRRADRLSAIGMRWEKKAALAWEESYEKAREFHAAHGHLDVPLGYRTEGGFELGRWLYAHRRAGAASLTEERRAKLDALGMAWGRAGRPGDAWRASFDELAEFVRENGALPSCGKGEPRQRRLWQWLYRQRRARARLSAEQAAMLDSLEAPDIQQLRLK